MYNNNADKRGDFVRKNADPYIGLTYEDVKEQFEKGLNNKKVKAQTNTVKDIILRNVFTYFNLVFFILALCIVLVGSFNDLVFMMVVIINTVIGIVWQLKSKRTLDKLSVISNPKTKVIREGKEITIDNELLVQDDIVIFTSGNQICADALVVDGSVRVNESLITGESDEIIKQKGDFLLSGSFVVSGTCRARLENVGENSYASRLTLEAKSKKIENKSEMIKSLDTIVKTIGILIIPVGLILFLNQHFTLGLSLKQSVVSTVGALVGMIPEGVYLLTSIALVMSVIRLAKKNTLVHDFSCIETLSRVNVLCIDKTGTITENEMEIEDTVILNEKYDVISKISDFAFNMEDDNLTIKTIKSHYKTGKRKKAIEVFNFSSETKYSGAVFDDESYILGAPEVILPDMDKSEIEKYFEKGLRVLLFAKYNGTLNGGNLTEDVIPLAYIVLSNKIRKNAHKIFEYFKNQGVDIKIISGDNMLSVCSVAKKSGIENTENAVDARTLTTYDEIKEATKKYTVFARVLPEQKRQIISALKENGKTVAMVGDGVNDVLALKEADCSVALLSGSDVACYASQLVLLDSDFASMPHIVSEGRRVINNIERAASLFLVKNIFSFAFAIICILAFLKYPIEPSQLTLIGAATIGIPSFFLAMEKNTNVVKGHFIKNVIFRAFPAGFANVILILAMYITALIFKIEHSMMSSMATIIMGMVGLSMLYRTCKPFNRYKSVLWVGMFLIFVLGATVFKELFSIAKLSTFAFLILVIFIVLAHPLVKILFYILEKTENMINKRKEKSK